MISPVLFILDWVMRRVAGDKPTLDDPTGSFANIVLFAHAQKGIHEETNRVNQAVSSVGLKIQADESQEQEHNENKSPW